MAGPIAGNPPKSGLMNFLQRPELWQWLGGVGAGMSRASRGQGYDITGANQQLFGAMRDRKMGAKLGGMMDQNQFGLSDQQRNFVRTLPTYMQQEVLAKYMFAERSMRKPPTGYTFDDPKNPAAGVTMLPGWKPSAGVNVNIGTNPYEIGVGEVGQPPAVAAPPPGAAIPAAPVPEEIDVSPALGVKGYAKGIANIADALGFGLPYEAAARAKSSLNVLEAETMTSLKGLVDQRMSNQLMDLFKKIIVEAGSFTTGPETAKITFEEVDKMLGRSLIRLQRISDNPGSFTKQRVSDARSDGDVLKALQQRFRGFIAALSQGDSPATTGGGEVFDLQDEQPWGSEIDELIRKYTDG